mmetsp:Transcript_80048/g.221318  ORF Transcript_80048/g.221318 Transcript_80048/m.221318 type:complete len:321 (+) Transcript_80048:542-1504(+)
MTKGGTSTSLFRETSAPPVTWPWSRSTLRGGHSVQARRCGRNGISFRSAHWTSRRRGSSGRRTNASSRCGPKWYFCTVSSSSRRGRKRWRTSGRSADIERQLSSETACSNVLMLGERQSCSVASVWTHTSNSSDRRRTSGSTREPMLPGWFGTCVVGPSADAAGGAAVLATNPSAGLGGADVMPRSCTACTKVDTVACDGATSKACGDAISPSSNCTGSTVPGSSASWPLLRQTRSSNCGSTTSMRPAGRMKRILPLRRPSLAQSARQRDEARKEDTLPPVSSAKKRWLRTEVVGTSLRAMSSRNRPCLKFLAGRITTRS